jgi:hypothetical protein
MMGAFTGVVLMSPIALAWERLSCSEEVCTVAHRVVPWSERRVPRATLRAARAERASGSDDETMGRLVLTVESGPDVRSMDVAFAAATEAAEKIDVAILEHRPVAVTLHTSWVLAILWLGALTGLAASIVRASRDRAPFRLDLIRDGAGLLVSRRTVGATAPYELALAGIADVAVEAGPVRRGWLDFESEDDPMVAARLVLVDRAGARRPLTPRFLLGHAVHLRAAADLRALLGLAPVPGGVEEQLAALAPTPMATGVRTLLMLFAFGTGLSVGFLFVVLPCVQAGGMDVLPIALQWIFGLGVAASAAAGLILGAIWTGPRLR